MQIINKINKIKNTYNINMIFIHYIRSQYSGKTSVTLDALLFLEHAASQESTGEAEDTESYG